MEPTIKDLYAFVKRQDPADAFNYLSNATCLNARFLQEWHQRPINCGGSHYRPRWDIEAEAKPLPPGFNDIASCGTEAAGWKTYDEVAQYIEAKYPEHI